MLFDGGLIHSSMEGDGVALHSIRMPVRGATELYADDGSVNTFSAKIVTQQEFNDTFDDSSRAGDVANDPLNADNPLNADVPLTQVTQPAVLAERYLQVHGQSAHDKWAEYRKLTKPIREANI